MKEKFPEFFSDVQEILMKDPLAEVLGSSGVMQYDYASVVRLAGHSCPTVAGAYLLTCKALSELYAENLPVRGQIKVELQNAQEEGVTGVVANVISYITGASGKGGFKGLNGKFARHSLLHFAADINALVKFTRIDTQKSVALSYNPNVVPSSPQLNELMQKVVSQSASKDEVKEFGELWQARVKRILIDNFENKEMINVV